MLLQFATHYPEAADAEICPSLRSNPVLVINTHATGGRTGVLIFVSLRERYCEIVADTAIALKVKDSAWQVIIDEMLPMLRRKQQAEALIHGIKQCSDLLADYFPPGMPNPNEIPDNLFIIDAEGRSSPELQLPIHAAPTLHNAGCQDCAKPA